MLTIHERWGAAGHGDFYPALCGLSPVARPTTSNDPENVNCSACIRRRCDLEEKGLLEEHFSRTRGGGKR